jgi:hypothetical protein
MEKSDAPQGQDQSTNKTDKSQNDDPGNQPASITQNASSQEKHNYTNYHSRPAHWWHRIDWSQVVLDVLLLIIGVKLALIYSGQLNQMIESNKINQSAVVTGQRAFVFVPETKINSAKDAKTGKKAWLFTPRMENGGNTPALNVHNYVSQNSPDYKAIPHSFEYLDRPSPVGTFPNTNVEPGPAIIGPHATLDMAGLGVADEVLQKVNIGAAHVCFWGWISYEDGFGCGHKTEFCEEVVSMSPDGHFIFNNCSQHNCSDGKCKDYEQTNKPICPQ